MIRLTDESLENIIKGEQTTLVWPVGTYEIGDLIEVADFKTDDIQVKLRVIGKTQPHKHFCEYKIILEWSKEGEAKVLDRLRWLGYL